MTICSDRFRPLANTQRRALGVPGLPVAIAPHPFGGLRAEAARERAGMLFEQVVAGLTARGEAAGTAPRQQAETAGDPLARHQVSDDLESVQRFFLEKGWADGLPVVPPTEDRVRRMLAAAPVDPRRPIAEIPPTWGAATPERIAVNAVMAGCRPEYFPIIVAAIEAICTPAFNLSAVQTTTHPCDPLLVINGPIRSDLGLNSGAGAFGPGWQANATIGRAVRLILMNIGGGLPGRGDMSTQGAPSKYTYCVAENEEENPWDPLHVERGYRRDQNTVTVFGAEPPHNINDHSSSRAEDVLAFVASTMTSIGSNNSLTGGETLLALGPEHARTIADDGFDKKRLREWLQERATIPLERYPKSTARDRFKDTAREVVSMVPTTEDLAVIVLGGPGKHSSWVPTFGGATRSVTREIRR